MHCTYIKEKYSFYIIIVHRVVGGLNPRCTTLFAELGGLSISKYSLISSNRMLVLWMIRSMGVRWFGSCIVICKINDLWLCLCKYSCESKITLPYCMHMKYRWLVFIWPLYHKLCAFVAQGWLSVLRVRPTWLAPVS